MRMSLSVSLFRPVGLLLATVCAGSALAAEAADTPAVAPAAASPVVPAATAAETTAPVEAVAAATSHEIEIGGSHAGLSDGSASWRDGYVKGTHGFGTQGTLAWELDAQRHFGEQGTLGSIAYTRDLSPDWYGSAGLSAGSASYMPRVRTDLSVYRKWLERRQLVTGLGLMWSRSGDGVHHDRAATLSGSYYFADLPLVAQTGVVVNTSSPGSVTTRRWFGAVTYGQARHYYLTLRHDVGHEGYLPAGQEAGRAFDFYSRVTTASWRQWITPRMGFVVGGEHYVNPYYRRQGVTAGLFADF